MLLHVVRFIEVNGSQGLRITVIPVNREHVKGNETMRSLKTMRKTVMAAVLACAMVAPLTACGMDGAGSAAQKIMDSVVAGDAKAVAAQSVMTQQFYEKVNYLNVKPAKPVEQVEVGNSQKVGDDVRSVAVSYVVDGKKQNVDLIMRKEEGNQWKAVSPVLFRMVSVADAAIKGTKSAADTQYAMVPGVYDVQSKGSWYQGSWKETITADSNFGKSIGTGLAAIDHIDALKATDAIKTDQDIQQDLANEISNLSMCQTLKQLYLNGQDFALVVGKSIANACRYNVSEVNSTITEYSAKPDSDGDFNITFDAQVTGDVAEFKDGGESDDEWTCQSVSGAGSPTQCARFVPKQYEVKGLQAQCDIYSNCRFVDAENTLTAFADVIYAGHGTD